MTSKNPYLLTLPELISAKKKISKVAAFYDPSKKGLKGFDSSALDATEFREQLRRNFLVKLTDAELGAIVFLFDQDGDRHVDSVEFINEFLRLGNLEKSRMRFQNQEAIRKIETNKVNEQERIRKKLEKLTAIKIVDTWTEADEESAVAKIAHVAFTYDSMKGGLGAFLNADSLTQSEFKEQLRRVFNIHLTPQETAALTNIYDKYHNGEVDTQEFVYHFFRTRRNELDYHNNRQAMKTKHKLEMDKRRDDEAVERFAKMTLAKTTPATEEEKQSALEKIRFAAAYYRKSPFIDAIQKSFEAEELAPTAFKELLFNNFEIRLSPGELDAVIKLFDTNCDGNISCVEFMTTFHRIGSEERMRILQEKRRRDHQLAQAEMERRRHIEANIKALTFTKVKWPELPEYEEDTIGGGSSVSHANDSSSDVLMGSASLASFKRRRPRKQSTVDILAPDKFASKLANTSRSLTELYPKASEATKNFIMDLEAKEREVRDLNSSTIKSGSSMNKIHKVPSMDSVSQHSQHSLHNGSQTHSETSSQSGMSLHKSQRRASKKAPIDNGMRSPKARPPVHTGGNTATGHNQHQQGGARHGDNYLSRQSTASSVYSEYDSFEPSTALPRDVVTLPRESNFDFGGDAYVEVEATLPLIEIDRPKTVHSYSRPGSSRSQTTSSSITGSRGHDGFEVL